jgi:NADH:ubiquinone oxidoreductase subunit E
MEITICIGSSCHLKGSHDVVKILERLVKLYQLENQVTLKGSFCMGECTSSGVCVSVGEERFKILPSQVEEFFQNVVLKKVNEDKSTNR